MSGATTEMVGGQSGGPTTRETATHLVELRECGSHGRQEPHRRHSHRALLHLLEQRPGILGQRMLPLVLVQRCPEGRHIVQALQRAIHIARIAQVCQTRAVLGQAGRVLLLGREVLEEDLVRVRVGRWRVCRAHHRDPEAGLEANVCQVGVILQQSLGLGEPHDLLALRGHARQGEQLRLERGHGLRLLSIFCGW